MARILIIDDDPELTAGLTDILESHDYEVMSAVNGTEGVSAAEDKAPDLIVLDVMMTHDTEGFDVAKQLNSSANTKGIPVVMLTGIRKAKTMPFKYEPDDDWLPVKAVLEKPVEPEVLLENIRNNLK